MMDSIMLLTILMVSLLLLGFGFLFFKLKNVIHNLNQTIYRQKELIKTLNFEIKEFVKKINDLNEENKQLIISNNELNSLNREQERFIIRITEILDDDIDFLKGTLAQKLSLDIPEVQDLYRGLTRFKNDIEIIKSILKEADDIKNG